MPFLDTIVRPEQNSYQSISVYRKPTHTDQPIPAPGQQLPYCSKI